MGTVYSTLSSASEVRFGRLMALRGPGGGRFNVLVCGPIHSGKSSFINSWYRVMAQRWADSADVCLTGTAGLMGAECMTLGESRVTFPGSAGLGVLDAQHLEFTHLNTLSDATKAVLRKMVQGVPTDCPLLGKAADQIPLDPANKVHAIIVVVDANKLNAAGNAAYAAQVTNLSRTIRDLATEAGGLPWAAVGTHKDAVSGSETEVMATVNLHTMSTGSTYAIENYVKTGHVSPPRRQDTDDVLLRIFDEFADFYAARERY